MCLSAFQQWLLPARLLWEWVCVLYEAGKFASTCIYFYIFSLYFVLFCVLLLSCSLPYVSLPVSHSFVIFHISLFFSICYPHFSSIFRFFVCLCPILYFFHLLCGIRVDQSDADVLWFFALTHRDTMGVSVSENIAAIIPFPRSKSQTPPFNLDLFVMFVEGCKVCSFSLWNIPYSPVSSSLPRSKCCRRPVLEHYFSVSDVPSFTPMWFTQYVNK
jgi:hypothetical protein